MVVRFHIIRGNASWCSQKPWGTQKFLFQQVVTDLLPPSSPLSKASAVYHSACLVDAFFALRPDWTRLRAIEAAVLQQLAHIQPTMPVMVNSLRCHGFPHQQAHHAFPVLWKEYGRFYRMCAEHAATPPIRRSIYMPYLDTWYRKHTIVHVRDRIVVFAGSLLTEVRHAVARAVNNTPGGEVIVFTNRQHRTVDLSVYECVACPPGDTPESQRIIQAIVHGSIPLISSRMYRYPFFDWASISFPLGFDKHGRIELPSPHKRAQMRIALKAANDSFFNVSRWREYIAGRWKAMIRP